MSEAPVEDFDFGDHVDIITFEQILEMDDGDEDCDFSKSIVLGFFEQAETTFGKMDNALAARQLEELSQLGHFLKGSSATLGFTKVKDECEKIQHFGAQKDVTGVHHEPDEAKCLKNIAIAVAAAKASFIEVEQLMRKYYKMSED